MSPIVAPNQESRCFVPRDLLCAVLVLLLLFSGALSGIATASADPLPESAPKQLASELASPDYNPRRSTTARWDDIKRKMWAEVLSLLHRVLKTDLPFNTEFLRDSWLVRALTVVGEFLLSFLEVLRRNFFIVLGLGVLLLLVIQGARRYRAGIAAGVRSIGSAGLPTDVTQLQLLEALYLELHGQPLDRKLSLIRSYLRILLRGSTLSTSLTDRELLRAARNFSPEVLAMFQLCLPLYEDLKYADLPPSQERLLELEDSFRHWIKHGQL